MIKKKTFCASGILAAVLVILPLIAIGCGGKAAQSSGQSSGAAAASSDIPEYKWSAALNVAETTINYKIVARFKDLIAEKSGGKIVVNVYPGGQLGGDKEMIEGLIGGNIDFLSSITTILVNFIPENAIFDLPSIFPNLKVMRAVLDSPFKDKMNEYNKQKNVRMLGYADAGFRQVTSNKPINSAKDIAGIKIRVMNNPYHIAYWKAVGANPVAMDFGEVYVALKQNVIDAEENPYMNIVGNKFYEVQKYTIETNHVGHIIIFIMGNKLYESLSDNVKKLVDDCSKSAIDYGRSIADESIAADKKLIQDKGVEIISLKAEDLDLLARDAASVHDSLRKKIGNEIFDVFFAEIEKAKKLQ